MRLALPPTAVFLVSLALDVRTLLPDVALWDTGEFQAIGPILGIAHPTGYPTYTLLAWLASVVLQPFGNEAYRANLLSAILISGAAALTCVLIVQLTRRWLPGVAAGLLLAVTPLAWRIALQADPHALHLFFAALMLVLLVGWMQRERAGAPGSGRWLLAASIVFGLSLGNHALTLLLAPGIGVFVFLVSPSILWRHWRLVLGCLTALVLTTMAVYAYIPIRAAMNPPLDYAIPTTWDRFRYVVLGEQFRGTFHQLPSLSGGAAIVWNELQSNLGAAAWLSLVGLALGVLRYRRVIVLTGLWFVLTFLFALGYENADIERYYLVPLFLAVIWAALAIDAAWTGLLALWARVSKGQSLFERAAGGTMPGRLALGLAAVILMVPILLPIPDRLPELDLSGDHGARNWMEATFAALPPNAVIVSWWSYSTALWYGHFVEGLRPDVTIIDDRTILDDGYGTVQNAIDAYLGKRPVYLIRISYDLPPLEQRYSLRLVPGLPALTDVYRVLPPRSA
jgi:4-amino-4-deoxy-L-arabinose transferase-like glycosyltransferase